MKDQKKANQTSKIVTIVVMILMLFVLIIFFANGGANTTQGILVAGLTIAFIISGFFRLKKIGNTPSTRPQTSVSQGGIESSSPTGTNTPSASVENTNFSPSVTTQTAPMSPWVAKLSKWMEKVPKKQQPFVAVGGGIVIIVFIILFISLITGNLFAASPVGTWKLEGYEERCTYIFYDDGTFVEYDTAFDETAPSYTGHWVQSGSHIDLVEETCPAMEYYDCTTSYWVISGDRMT